MGQYMLDNELVHMRMLLVHLAQRKVDLVWMGMTAMAVWGRRPPG